MNGRTKWLSLMGAGLLLTAMIGCSESPTAPQTGGSDGTAVESKAPAADSLQLRARVQTVDQNRLRLTLEGETDTVATLQNCQIVRYSGFSEAPVPFTEIRVNDSVEVAGHRYQNACVNAYRIGICEEPGAVRYAARVETVNRDRRMLTFAGKPDSVIANLNCAVVRLNGNSEAPVPFDEINPGDSVQLYGERNQNRYVYARHLGVCSPGGGGYDVAVRDTITSIDYAAGTFTIAGRTELITVDSETVIWTNLRILHEQPDENGRDRMGMALSDGGNFYRSDHDSILAFTDVAVGDVIELRADIVNETTLRAAVIKLTPECLSRCLAFSDRLATIDVAARLVTFENETRICWVCPGAKLRDRDGAEITLADFAVGDFVAVKGYPLAGDTLKISQMALTAEP
ncbi:MAG TPA: hypothetical protein PLR32_06360 [candidate division Zixibacteria bacterium]|nr:hypothetical protein [candidate division Zixibacteria bacterium]MDD4918357.1 hypothetical protein [candidate division Zixibacteria bacterium]MDM7973307.1 hypothetical protein [candidate division Zixibacteria bacterium]HOD66321.1 hypothetical protein [candidate division Zixibacteria bacterium]HPI32920.1 hypothetical protein [candidate division Zixibacteria bacterium]